MKAIPFTLLFLSSIVVADTTVYQCEMSVADVKNGALTDVIKAPYGAMVVDSGDQFYVAVKLCVKTRTLWNWKPSINGMASYRST